MPIATDKGHSYNDSPSPRRLGNVSSLDPVLFASVEETADEMAGRRPSGRYSSLDVARWLDDLASCAETHLARARAAGKADRPAFRRWAVDVQVQAGIARSFAEKLRAALAYAFYEKTGDPAALERALRHRRAAEEAWQGLAGVASVYVKDLTFGRDRHLRGHWADRLDAMRAHRAEMQKARPAAITPTSVGDGTGPAAALLAAMSAKPAARPACRHTPVTTLRRGAPLSIELSADGLAGVRLLYRHVNQAEEYRTLEMWSEGVRYRAEVPGEYTDSRYPLVYFFYFFELRDGGGQAWLYPGLGADLAGQPYFIVRTGA